MAEQCENSIGDSGDAQEEWAFDINQAAKELLDHVAQEIAREYVRLVQEGPGEQPTLEMENTREVEE